MQSLYRSGLLLTIIIVAIGAETCDKEMTFTVEAGRKDCFYQAMRTGEVIELEYQVIDGGHGDLDINFALNEPSDRILFADFKKSDNTYRHKAIVDGDYAICFDNTISRFNKKTVFLELIVENEDGNSDDNDGNGANWPVASQLSSLTAEEFYDMKIEDIQNAVGRIRVHLSKARQTQDMLRSHEARDRNWAEASNTHVQIWSIFQIIVMVSVAAVQVHMVRSLFETDASRATIWKRLKM